MAGLTKNKLVILLLCVVLSTLALSAVAAPAFYCNGANCDDLVLTTAACPEMAVNSVTLTCVETDDDSQLPIECLLAPTPSQYAQEIADASSAEPTAMSAVMNLTATTCDTAHKIACGTLPVDLATAQDCTADNGYTTTTACTTTTAPLDTREVSCVEFTPTGAQTVALENCQDQYPAGFTPVDAVANNSEVQTKVSTTPCTHIVHTSGAAPAVDTVITPASFSSTPLTAVELAAVATDADCTAEEITSTPVCYAVTFDEATQQNVIKVVANTECANFPTATTVPITCGQVCSGTQVSGAAAGGQVTLTTQCDDTTWSLDQDDLDCTTTTSATTTQYKYCTITADGTTYFMTSASCGEDVETVDNKIISLSCFVECADKDDVITPCSQTAWSVSTNSTSCQETHVATAQCKTQYAAPSGTVITNTTAPNICGPSAPPAWVTNTTAYNAATDPYTQTWTTPMPGCFVYSLMCHEDVALTDAAQAKDCSTTLYTTTGTCTPTDLTTPTTATAQRGVFCVGRDSTGATTMGELSLCQTQFPLDGVFPAPADLSATSAVQDGTNSCATTAFVVGSEDGTSVGTKTTNKSLFYTSMSSARIAALGQVTDCTIAAITITTVCVLVNEDDEVVYMAAAECGNIPLTPTIYNPAQTPIESCTTMCSADAISTIQVGDVVDPAFLSNTTAWDCAATQTWNTTALATMNCDTTLSATVTQWQYCAISTADDTVYIASTACSPSGQSQTAPFEQVVTQTCGLLCKDSNDQPQACGDDVFRINLDSTTCVDDVEQTYECVPTFANLPTGVAAPIRDYTPSKCGGAIQTPQPGVNVTEFNAATAAYTASYTLRNKDCPLNAVWSCHSSVQTGAEGEEFLNYQECINFDIEQYQNATANTGQWSLMNQGSCEPDAKLHANRTAVCVMKTVNAQNVASYVYAADDSACVDTPKPLLTAALSCSVAIGCGDGSSQGANPLSCANPRSVVTLDACRSQEARDIFCYTAITDTTQTINVDTAVIACPLTDAAFSAEEQAVWDAALQVGTTKRIPQVFSGEIIPNLDTCEYRCATNTTQNTWSSCAQITPEVTPVLGACVELSWVQSLFEKTDVDSLSSFQQLNMAFADETSCAAICTECGVGVCSYTNTNTTFITTPQQMDDTFCPTQQDCTCLQPVAEATLLQLTADWWIIPNTTETPLTCGDDIIYQLNTTEIECTTTTGNFSFGLTCYNDADIRAGEFTMAYECAHQCTACGMDQCNATYTATNTAFTLPQAPACDAKHEQCACVGKCVDNNGADVDCAPTTPDLFVFDETQTNCTQIVKAINTTTNVVCFYASDLINPVVEGGCVVDNMLTLAADNTQISTIVVDTAVTCAVSEFDCSVCGETTVKNCTATSATTNDSFDITPTHCDYLITPESCSCGAVCVVTPPQIGELVEDIIDCHRPSDKMCTTWKPSEERTKVCVNAQNIRIACDAEGGDSIVEADVPPAESCANICFAAEHATLSDAYIAAAPLAINCTAYDFRGAAADPCATLTQASTVRNAVCAFLNTTSQQYVESMGCADLQQVQEQEWKAEECQAVCHPVGIAPLTGEYDLVSLNSTDMVECTADVFKPLEASCKLTNITDVRGAFCGYPLSNGNFSVAATNACAQDFVTAGATFPIDPTCSTVCAATTNTTIFVSGEEVTFVTTPCEEDTFRPSQCGNFTQDEVQALRTVGCTIMTADNKMIALMPEDCQITAESLGQTPLLNQTWVGDETCQHWCSVEDFAPGEAINTTIAQPCTETTLPPQKGCAGETINRFVYCALKINDVWTIDPNSTRDTPCYGFPIEDTADFVYTKKDTCTFEWRCNNATTINSTIFTDYVECSDASFSTKYCPTGCGAQPMESVALCISTAPQSDGSIESADPLTNCGVAEVPTFDCTCDTACRATSSDDWDVCVDVDNSTSTQWVEPTTCGGLTTRQTALKTKTGAYTETCAAPFNCAEQTLPIAERLPKNDTVATQCANVLTPMCTNLEDNAENVLQDYLSCENDGAFKPCDALECGAGYTRQRHVECLADGEFVETFVNNTFVNNTNEQVYKDFYLDILNTLCTPLVANVSTTKQCGCDNALWCLKEFPTTPLPPGAATNYTFYQSCANDTGYPTCLTTCVDDDRVAKRDVYCRKTDGEFVVVTADNLDECDGLTYPEDEQECVGTAQCAGKFFCQALGAAPLANGLITNNECTAENFWSEQCFLPPTTADVWPDASTCIIDGVTDGEFYRRRQVQCLLYIDDENNVANHYPAIPTNVTLPEGQTPAEYCASLAGVAPAASNATTTKSCETLEGCEETFDGFNAASATVAEGATLAFNWSYVGKPSSQAKLTLAYALAVVSSTSSPALQWVSITTPTTAPLLSAETFVWNVPETVINRQTPGVESLFIRAYIDDDVTTTQYSTKIAITRVDTCDNIGDVCQRFGAAQPNCAIENGEPTCLCAQPTAASTQFTTSECDRTDVCDQKGATVCQNGGYLRFDATLSTPDQCQTSCFCPGGQVGDCSTCSATNQCNTARGVKAADVCGCQKCWRGFDGANCELCAEYAQLFMTAPNAEAEKSFNTADNNSADAAVRINFYNNLLEFIATTLNYDIAFIQVEQQYSGVITKDGVKTLATFIKFSGQCTAQLNGFNLQQQGTTPQLSTAKTSWAHVANGFATSAAYQSVATPDSIVTSSAYPALDMPQESLDCAGADKAHPSCKQDPETPNDGGSSGSGAIIGAVVGVIGGVILIAVIVLVAIFCCKKSGNDDKSYKKESSKPSSYDEAPSPKNKKKAKAQNEDHLELV